MYQPDQTFGQTLPWVCLWGCICMKLTFESVDWIKQITTPQPHPTAYGPVLIEFQEIQPNVDEPYPTNWKLTEQKGWIRVNTSSLTELGHQSFSAFRLGLKHQLFLGLETAGFGVGMCTTSSTGPQARCRPGLPQLSWVSSLPAALLGTFQPP